MYFHKHTDESPSKIIKVSKWEVFRCAEKEMLHRNVRVAASRSRHESRGDNAFFVQVKLK